MLSGTKRARCDSNSALEDSFQEVTTKRGRREKKQLLKEIM